MEKVSAIITTHKRDICTVVRAVNSVIQQTYDNIEIIIVDDSPEEYADREAVEAAVLALQTTTQKKIQYVKHERCLGACAARNTGLRLSTGSIIGYLDDDDEWLPQKVDHMLPLFNHKNTALVYCNDIKINDSTGEENRIVRSGEKGAIYPSLIKSNIIGSTSFPLLRKEYLSSIGGFDTEMQSAQDADVWLRLAERYDVDFVNEFLVLYHVHDGEQISKNVKKKIAGLERLNEKTKAYLLLHKDAYWISFMKLIPHYVRDGQIQKAFKTWQRCVKKCPGNIRGNMGFLKIILKGVLTQKKN